MSLEEKLSHEEALLMYFNNQGSSVNHDEVLLEQALDDYVEINQQSTRQERTFGSFLQNKKVEGSKIYSKFGKYWYAQRNEGVSELFDVISCTCLVS